VKTVLPLFALALCTLDPAHAQSSRALLQQHHCYTCHANHETKAGPAFADVAARYEGDQRASAALVATIRQGAHSSPWHMPPGPEMSEADAKKMARYILSLKR
jgi:cytochrome c